MTREDILPELPPLADDGALADVDDGFIPDDRDVGTDDRASHDLALGSLIDAMEDIASALDDRAADIEDEVLATNDPEGGWLDDATMEIDLGVSFDADDHAPLANDGGADGIDDDAPRRANEDADDDASGLPTMTPGSEGEGIDEPVVVPVVGED